MDLIRQNYNLHRYTKYDFFIFHKQKSLLRWNLIFDAFIKRFKLNTESTK